jgi:hypothetical protein
MQSLDRKISKTQFAILSPNRDPSHSQVRLEILSHRNVRFDLSQNEFGKTQTMSLPTLKIQKILPQSRRTASENSMRRYNGLKFERI